MTESHRLDDHGGIPIRLPSFWRRLAAFAIDMILLGLIDEVIRAQFSDPLGPFGNYGRLIRWACVMAYFGCFESRWGGGRSIGKRLLGLCVIRPDNTYLSPVEAGLRAALATAPLLFNHISYRPPSPIGGGFVGGLIGIAILGLPLSALYLVVLAGNKRKALPHDLVFGTMVVRRDDQDLQRLALPLSLWRGHVAVLSVILLASFLFFFTMVYFAALERMTGT